MTRERTINSIDIHDELPCSNDFFNEGEDISRTIFTIPRKGAFSTECGRIET